MLYYFYTLTEGLNLNSCYYETLEKNFNEAVALCESDFTHEELINMLENGNIPQKQIAALKLTEIKNRHRTKNNLRLNFLCIFLTKFIWTFFIEHYIFRIYSIIPVISHNPRNMDAK